MSPAEPVTSPELADSRLDEALEALAGTAPEFGPAGLSNHGPMAAEALVALGQGDAVAGFVARYRRHLDPGPTLGTPPGLAEVAELFGDAGRYADLRAFFAGELADGAPADEVVARWVPRLAPGTVAAAFHGLLRTAHAARAVRAADTAPRRAELASGLAYWAARYEELPGPPVLAGRRGLDDAYRHLPAVDEDAPRAKTITGSVRAVAAIAPAFEAGVVALHPTIDLELAVDELAAVGATAYARNAEAGIGDAVALVHTVTGPMALELLLPSLGQPERESAFAYTWQAAAAIHATFSRDRRPVDPTEVLVDLPYPEELAAAAVESGDEHAIKLTEAALRAYQRTGEPVLLAAAADACDRLRA